MVTIGDVAREARVSVATVSRALNGNDSVDPTLAERVRRAASSLNYRPNAVARNLRRRTTQVWALIITDVSNPFFTAVARGVEDAASRAGYSVLLCNSDEDRDKETRYLTVAEEERVAGVVLAPRDPATDVSRLTRSGIPVVAIDRSMDVPVDTVRVNSRQGAVSATEHLLARGWTRPACITGPADTETARERAAGYRQVMKAHGLKPLVQHVPFDIDGGAHATAALLDDPDAPDSFFLANSQLALGALQELKRRQLGVGDGIGLVAFDDAPWASVVDPPITVVAQPAYDVGFHAGTMLASRIQGGLDEPAHLEVFETTLVVRGSCRRPAAETGRRTARPGTTGRTKARRRSSSRSASGEPATPPVPADDEAAGS